MIDNSIDLKWFDLVEHFYISAKLIVSAAGYKTAAFIFIVNIILNLYLNMTLTDFLDKAYCCAL